MELHGEPLRLPEGYQTQHGTVPWSEVHERLVHAQRYWLATTRPDGRPHVVPVDGIWLDDCWYFGGHPDTVHQRNLATNRAVSMHLEDATQAVIVDGRVEHASPSPDLARRLAAASAAKYGWAPPPESYTQGVWRLVPDRVLAWTRLAEDATRFRVR